jgi:hypothetical protein
VRIPTCAISTIGNPAAPIGAGYMTVDDAGYMIVNELAFIRGLWIESAFAAGLAEPDLSSRIPTCARGSSSRLAETLQ